MILKTKVQGEVRVPVASFKNEVTEKGLDPVQKERISSEIIKKEFKDYVNKVLGVYIGVDQLKILAINEDEESFYYVNIKFECNVYFFKVQPKEIYDFKITELTPLYIRGSLNNSIVEVSKTELSNYTVTYIPGKNIFELGDKQKIKEGDLIRIKVTNCLTSLVDEKFSYVIKGSCRSLGLGKL